MKVIRLVLGILFGVSIVLAVLAPLIGSLMQGYYKSQLGENPQLTESLLKQKNFWVQIGETKIFIFICLLLFILFLLSFSSLFKSGDGS